MRTIGRNHRADIETYISRQVVKEQFIDTRHQAFLEKFTIQLPGVDLSVPSETNSGRYWYNLHVVLVSEGRQKNHDAQYLGTLRDQSLQIAAKKGHHISALSAMPDHLHLALRGNLEESPEMIALAFMNNLAYTFGQQPVWRYGYYVGTFGEYDMNAVRGF